MQDPYGLGGYGGRAVSREVLIPLIILVVIGVIILGKTTTMFCGVPVIGDMFCGSGQTNIAVIGSFSSVTGDGETAVDGPNMRLLLDSELGSAYAMQYQTFQPEDLEFVQETLLQDFDLVILVGDRLYSRPVKDAAEAYLQGGGKIMLIGDAATKDPDDAVYNGWGKIGVPIQLKTTGTDIPTMVLGAPITLKIVSLNHPIVEGYGLNIDLTEIENKPSCSSNLEIVDVNPTQGGVIAMMTGTSEGNEVSKPAIVEGGSMFGGTVIYFAMDPGCLPNMFISTVQYLTGK